MAPHNRAAWLTAKQSPVYAVDSAPYTSPIADELVIKVKAVAINPADVLLQQTGMLLTDYPAILGCDAAGEVVEVHPSLADKYQVGDRVIGATSPLTRRDPGDSSNTYCYSGFQEYAVLKTPSIARIPANVRFEDAVVLPLGINTATSCLFAKETLRLDFPSLNNDNINNDDNKSDQKKKTVIVWGASSSVGASGVQMLIQAGYEVVAVASAKNHEMVRSLGTGITCFDHNDPNIVDDIVSYLQDKEVVGAFDAISTDETLDAVCRIISGGCRHDGKEGIVKVAGVKPGAEEKATNGVQVVTNFAIDVSSSDVPSTIWAWLDRAMEAGRVQYMPPPEIVGHGLENVQRAVDILAKGVSAKKLVVSL